jgi:hypothetical protein
LSKIINAQNFDMSCLSELERDSFKKMITLSENNYADSELLNTLLSSVSDFVAAGSDNISKVMKATTIDEIIEILNEI